MRGGNGTTFVEVAGGEAGVSLAAGLLTMVHLSI